MAIALRSRRLGAGHISSFNSLQVTSKAAAHRCTGTGSGESSEVMVFTWHIQKSGIQQLSSDDSTFTPS